MSVFQYSVVIGTEISDESGGNVYGMLFSNQHDPLRDFEVTEDVIRGKFENMDNEIASDGTRTVITGNVLRVFSNIDNALYNNETSSSIEIDKEYYIYLYAVDTMNNSTIFAYNNNTKILLSKETTYVYHNSSYFVTTTDGFGEMRNLVDIQPPSVVLPPSTNTNTTDYLNDTYDKLLMNVRISPGEYVIGNTKMLSLENYVDAEINFVDIKSKFDSINPTTLMDSANQLAFSSDLNVPVIIDPLVGNIYNADASKNLVYGKQYSIYILVSTYIDDRVGVQFLGNVTGGTYPVVHTADADMMAQ